MLAILIELISQRAQCLLTKALLSTKQKRLEQLWGKNYEFQVQLLEIDKSVGTGLMALEGHSVEHSAWGFMELDSLFYEKIPQFQHPTSVMFLLVLVGDLRVL